MLDPIVDSLCLVRLSPLVDSHPEYLLPEDRRCLCRIIKPEREVLKCVKSHPSVLLLVVPEVECMVQEPILIVKHVGHHNQVLSRGPVV